MSSWFLGINGQQQGPFSDADVRAKVAAGTVSVDVLAWRDGMASWVAVGKIGELNGPAEAPASAPPIPTSGGVADEIDYQIVGSEMQFVEIELDPKESVVAEAGGMMYMTDGITLNTIFGDGTQQSAPKGILDYMVGAGKRILTGESLFMTLFTNTGQGKQHVAFAAPYPGKIIPVDLAKMGGRLICQKQAFLCAARGVSIGIAFQKKIGVGLFGGEGFIMQKLEGKGLCFVHAGGTIVEKQLEAGRTLRVDTGCLVALQDTVTYDVQFVGDVKSALFGGEGFFYATLTGPGKVWLQSLPFSRLAGKIAEVGRKGGVDEGSAIDGVVGKGIGQLLRGG
jgi:uncharacterized protein (TIGR00266 family)